MMGAHTALRCMFCGEPEFVRILEVWGGREFMLDACCPSMHEAAVDELNDDPKTAAKWLGNLGCGDDHGSDLEVTLPELMRFEPGCVGGLRRVIDHNSQLQLDWNLQVVPVSWRAAKAFVRAHHRHCRPPAGWRFGAAVKNGPDVIAVAIVGRPVARLIDQHRIVEVNRLCVRQDLAPGLEWNACSLLYGWSAREAKKRGFERIITYTLESEAGTTLKAAGWTPNSHTRGATWDWSGRRRLNPTPTVAKVRWERLLVRNPASVLNPVAGRSGRVRSPVLQASNQASTLEVA